MLIERLKHDLRSQERRVVRAQQELGLVERQKQSAKQLLEALQKDAALAQTEASIAVRESQRAEASWAALWSPIARASAQKAQKIAQEERKGLNRIRSLDIESTLAVSQMAYRDAKIVDLKAQIRSTSSLEGWTDAIVASVTIWLTESLKVLLALLGIWLLLKLALRMIGASQRRRATWQMMATTITSAGRAAPARSLRCLEASPRSALRGRSAQRWR